MWTLGIEHLEIALRSAIIYTVLIIGIRLVGKREIGQMTPFDLVLLLLISNAVQNAMTGPDTSLTGGLVSALTLLMMNLALSRLGWKNKKFRRTLEGNPTLLIHQGTLQKHNLDREHITAEELQQALREHGVATIADVYLATLEIDGSISVLKNEERPTTFQPHHRIRLLQRKT